MPEVSPAMDRKVYSRSSLSNASKMLVNIDGRTTYARRYRDILNALVVEYVLTNEADMALARAVAAQSVWLEAETAKMAKGEPINDVMLTRATNAVRRARADLETTKRRRRT